MAMDEASRLQYLQAMGIDVWVPRHRPVSVGIGTEAGPSLRLDDHENRETAFTPLLYTEEDWDKDNETIGKSGWFEQNAHAVNPASLAPLSEARSTIISPPPAGITAATEKDWTTLQHEVAACRACRLCETRTQTVFGVGNRHAGLMLIGEAPGQDEDLLGEPFVGKAGQLLTEMLRAMGFKREDVYIANILKCRPPHNRDPEAGEVAACNRFLKRQIALLQPKLILAVGRIAAQNLLETKQSLAKLRGVRHQFDNIPLIAIYHPAYLLRSLLEKAKAWEDLQFALSVYKELEK